MIKALDAYTAIWRKGCTPPDVDELDQQRDNNNRRSSRRRW